MLRLGTGVGRLGVAATLEMPVAPQLRAARPLRERGCDVGPARDPGLVGVGEGDGVRDPLELDQAHQPVEDRGCLTPGDRNLHTMSPQICADVVEEPCWGEDESGVGDALYGLPIVTVVHYGSLPQ